MRLTVFLRAPLISWGTILASGIIALVPGCSRKVRRIAMHPPKVTKGDWPLIEEGDEVGKGDGVEMFAVDPEFRWAIACETATTWKERLPAWADVGGEAPPENAWRAGRCAFHCSRWSAFRPRTTALYARGRRQVVDELYSISDGGDVLVASLGGEGAVVDFARERAYAIDETIIAGSVSSDGQEVVLVTVSLTGERILQKLDLISGEREMLATEGFTPFVAGFEGDSRLFALGQHDSGLATDPMGPAGYTLCGNSIGTKLSGLDRISLPRSPVPLDRYFETEDLDCDAANADRYEESLSVSEEFSARAQPEMSAPDGVQTGPWVREGRGFSTQGPFEWTFLRVEFRGPDGSSVQMFGPETSMVLSTGIQCARDAVTEDGDCSAFEVEVPALPHRVWVRAPSCPASEAAVDISEGMSTVTVEVTVPSSCHTTTQGPWQIIGNAE